MSWSGGDGDRRPRSKRSRSGCSNSESNGEERTGGAISSLGVAYFPSECVQEESVESERTDFEEKMKRSREMAILRAKPKTVARIPLSRTSSKGASKPVLSQDEDSEVDSLSDGVARMWEPGLGTKYLWALGPSPPPRQHSSDESCGMNAPMARLYKEKLKNSKDSTMSGEDDDNEVGDEGDEGEMLEEQVDNQFPTSLPPCRMELTSPLPSTSWIHGRKRDAKERHQSPRGALERHTPVFE